MTLLLFQVRDGSMSSSPLLGTYCGVEIPPRLQSTQRSMYLRFTTDSSVSNHGFEAAYGSALEGEDDVNIRWHQGPKLEFHDVPVSLECIECVQREGEEHDQHTLFFAFRLRGYFEQPLWHHHKSWPPLHLPPRC